MNILEKIVEKTRARVAKLDVNALKLQAPTGNAHFAKAIKKAGSVGFICEIKKASPSKGIIDAEFNYKKIALDYQRAGADALSVLTEPDFFLGSIEYLKEIRQIVNIPILRKDFIIDEAQIYESKIIGADALLLIVSILTKEQLKIFIELAHSLGMDALVEAHDEKEVETAISAGAKIVGVNNRDLKTFNVNFANSIRLRKMVPDNAVFVAESGITSPEDVKLLKDNNVNAVLIGETLMRSENKGEMLKSLKSLI
jgi:indole-3-glycerol phosphate synthase